MTITEELFQARIDEFRQNSDSKTNTQKEDQHATAAPAALHMALGQVYLPHITSRAAAEASFL